MGGDRRSANELDHNLDDARGLRTGYEQANKLYTHTTGREWCPRRGIGVEKEDNDGTSIVFEGVPAQRRGRPGGDQGWEREGGGTWA